MPHVAACAINLERVTQFAGNANGMATGGRSATCESVRRISSLACGFVSDRSMDICFSSENTTNQSSGKLSAVLNCHEITDIMPVAASTPPPREQFPIDWRHLQNELSDDRQRSQRGRVCLGMGDHRDIRKSFADTGITEPLQHP